MATANRVGWLYYFEQSLMTSTKHVGGFRESDLTSVKRVGGLQKFGQSVLNPADRIFGESVMTSEKRVGYGRFVEDRCM